MLPQLECSCGPSPRRRTSPLQRSGAVSTARFSASELPGLCQVSTAHLGPSNPQKERNTMKAILCRAFGPPDTLELAELPDPQPGPGQVVIDVAACGVNFPDTLVIE